MTDTDALNILQYRLIETVDGGATVSSGLWTPLELRDALNTAQQWVIREVWPLVSDTVLNTVPNVQRYPLPQTWMETIRVAWEESDGTIVSLGRDSSWSADYLEEDWTYKLAPRPQIYSDSDAPVPTVQVMPSSYDNGVLHVWSADVPPALDGSGVAWVIPTCWVPMCIWKATAILLGKLGRAQDGPRARDAEQRAMEGLEAARVMVGGWRAGLQ